MDNNLKIKIWKKICIGFFLLTMFLIICIFGLRKRVDDLQIQLEQCVNKEEQNLTPCPMCGDEVKINPVNSSFYIKCDDFFGKDGCGLQTGYYDSKTELIEQWNDMKILPSNKTLER